ncbi:hypothetical protein D3C76_449940 [compost metagenome]
MHAGQLEVRLDVARLQAAQVLFDPGRPRRHGHFTVGGLDPGAGQRCAFQVLRVQQLHDVHLGGVDRHRHLVRLGGQLGQHVPGVVAQPLGRFAFAFGRKGNRATHLDDHVRYRFADPGDQFVELGQALGAGAIEFAHVQVEHRGARFIAVDCLLHLLIHGDRDVLREIIRHPLGAIGRHGDDYLFHVFRVQRVVEELHV